MSPKEIPDELIDQLLPGIRALRRLQGRIGC